MAASRRRSSESGPQSISSAMATGPLHCRVPCGRVGGEQLDLGAIAEEKCEAQRVGACDQQALAAIRHVARLEQHEN